MAAVPKKLSLALKVERDLPSLATWSATSVLCGCHRAVSTHCGPRVRVIRRREDDLPRRELGERVVPLGPIWLLLRPETGRSRYRRCERAIPCTKGVNAFWPPRRSRVTRRYGPLRAALSNDRWAAARCASTMCHPLRLACRLQQGWHGWCALSS